MIKEIVLVVAVITTAVIGFYHGVYDAQASDDVINLDSDDMIINPDPGDIVTVINGELIDTTK